MDYFRLFYEYFEEKVSDFLFVKSGSVIIFFLYNLVANFAREYESSHDRIQIILHINCNLIYIYKNKIRTYFKMEHTGIDTPK